MLFRTEFDELASQSGGRVKIVCGSDGFLTADNIRMWVPDFAEASFYVCGQPSFSEPISKVLDDLLIRKTRRRITLCGQPGDIERHKQFPEGHDGKTYTITVLFGINRREIPARSLETVAVALERAGLAIDTRCRSGTCGWCRSKLESGMIWQRPEGDGVRAKDRDAGYFHPCSAYPISDLTVRVFTRL
jgi:ferredoxin